MILSLGGLPPLSARGCVQELLPVEQGKMRRTINGELVFVGTPRSKYRSIIHCSDKTSLATDGLSPGAVVQVGCIQRLWQKVLPDTNNNPIRLERAAVEESVVAMDESQKMISVERLGVDQIRLKERRLPCFVSYRPWLSMRTVRYSLHTNEWGLKAGWRLELEEI